MIAMDLKSPSRPISRLFTSTARPNASRSLRGNELYRKLEASDEFRALRANDAYRAVMADEAFRQYLRLKPDADDRAIIRSYVQIRG